MHLTSVCRLCFTASELALLLCLFFMDGSWWDFWYCGAKEVMVLSLACLKAVVCATKKGKLTMEFATERSPSKNASS